jgi:hypothetical protein
MAALSDRVARPRRLSSCLKRDSWRSSRRSCRCDQAAISDQLEVVGVLEELPTVAREGDLRLRRLPFWEPKQKEGYADRHEAHMVAMPAHSPNFDWRSRPVGASPSTARAAAMSKEANGDVASTEPPDLLKKALTVDLVCHRFPAFFRETAADNAPRTKSGNPKPQPASPQICDTSLTRHQL